jgi:SulP family sulfate permease
VETVERSPEGCHVVLDASQMVSLDTTGLDALEQLHKALDKRGGQLSITGLNEQPASLVHRSGFASRLHPLN